MLEQPLIGADQTWALLAALLVLAAFGLWAETTKWGGNLSGAVIAILGGMLLSNLSIIPASSGLYDMIWSYVVPLAIPMLLFNADLKRIFRESGPTLLAFIIGGIGTVVGTVFAYWVVPLGEEGWKVAGIFCSTYIGGSINYVASAEALQMQAGNPLLAAGIAADNLVMTLYFLLLFALPSFVFLRKRYRDRHSEKPAPRNAALGEDKREAKREEKREEKLEEKGEGVTLLNMMYTLAISAVVCAVGFGISGLIGVKPAGILIITAISVLLATFFPKRMAAVKGADQVGMVLMQVFFAAIGVSANIMIVIKVGPMLFVFAALILLVHLVFILLGGKLFKLDLIEIVIASNANMGGPTTAAAMAVARRWDGLVIPAILSGTFGYAVATFVGVAVGYWLK